MSRRLWILGIALVASLAVLAACEGTSVFDLEVGDCLLVPGGGGTEQIQVGRVTTVDCSDPHDGEVIALVDLEGDEFPGDNSIFQLSVDVCPTEASFYLYPSEVSWEDKGDREVVCIEQLSS